MIILNKFFKTKLLLLKNKTYITNLNNLFDFKKGQVHKNGKNYSSSFKISKLTATISSNNFLSFL